ncbi:MAG: adenylate/guanylate cyclase domain-containing protein [Gammaproteobacteria bacterium]|nr:adenylate/guanylate cyclase domain-containing protein [Gammaproteobacteria bacterium]
MAEARAQRRLTTILAADAVGYSRLMGRDEEAALRTLKGHREVIDRVIARHEGRVFGSAGDSVMAEFGSAVEAVRAAIAIQEELAVRNAERPDDGKMSFRIGVNLGDVMVEGKNLYGDGVNVAARIEGLCVPGGVYVSGGVHQQVEGKLSVGFEDKGAQAVKNIAKPVRVYQVVGVSPDQTDAVPDEDSFPLPDKPSIAVLPFENMSGDPEQDYFSDGISEDIITDLAKISGLFVVARNAAFLYKNQAVKPAEVSRDLGVRYVLEGSVRKAGDRVRISAQLIDAGTGYHLWAERYDRELTDIFALQDEITEKIVAALEVRLSAREQEQVASRYTDNPDAYDYFLRGRAYQYRQTKESAERAREMFERAIELDSVFAGAYALLSYTHYQDWRYGWRDDPKILDLALQTARQAVSLDRALPLAHTYLAWIFLWKRRHQEAVAEAETAIELDPNFAEGYAYLGNVLNFAGRPKEGIAMIRRAMRLDPHHPPQYFVSLARGYELLGEDESAIAALKACITRDPDRSPPHGLLASIYGRLGRKKEAQAEAAEVSRLRPEDGLYGFLVNERDKVPYKDPAALERYLDGLREAGFEG